MAAGRPQKLSTEDALESAMMLFWERGYECTSISMLEKALSAGRQSIYNTFGDKHALFLKAYKHYLNTRLQDALSLLRIDGSPEDQLKNLFHQSLDCTAGKHFGCFIGNTFAAPSASEEHIAAITQQAVDQFITALCKTLTPLVTDENARTTISWQLFTFFQGCQLLAKNTDTREALLKAIDFNIESIIASCD